MDANTSPAGPLWDMSALETEQELENFQSIKSWIYHNLSFNPCHYNDSYLKRRIQSRLFFLQLRSYETYLKRLQSDEDEQTRLLNNLTVNVTRFFRNSALWEAIKANVIPGLIKRKGANAPLKCWCAGCASGEEPYSLAIVLAEYFNASRPPPNIEIYATDISSDVLDKAIIGEYTVTQLSETSSERLERFFTQENGTYVISEKIKKSVSFFRHDLFRDEPLRGMDLIICRNVVIYFTNEAKQALYRNFYNCLNEGGFYIIGKSETLIGPARQLFKFVNSEEKIYQKVAHEWV